MHGFLARDVNPLTPGKSTDAREPTTYPERTKHERIGARRRVPTPSRGKNVPVPQAQIDVVGIATERDKLLPARMPAQVRERMSRNSEGCVRDHHGSMCIRTAPTVR